MRNNTLGSVRLLRGYWASPAQLRSITSDLAPNNGDTAVWTSENVATISSASSSVGAINRGCAIFALLAPKASASADGHKDSANCKILGEVLCGWQLGTKSGDASKSSGVAVRCGPAGAFSAMSDESLKAVLTVEPVPSSSAASDGDEIVPPDGDKSTSFVLDDTEKADVVVGGVNMSELGSGLFASMSAAAQDAKEAMEAAQAKAKVELEKSLAETDAAPAAKTEGQKTQDLMSSVDNTASKSAEGWGASLRSSWSAVVSSAVVSDVASVGGAEAEAKTQREMRVAELAHKAVSAPSPALCSASAAESGTVDVEASFATPATELTVAQKKAKDKAEKTIAEMRSGLAYSMLGGVHSYGELYATAALGHDATTANEASVPTASDEVRVDLEGWPDAFTCYFTITQVEGLALSSSSDDEDEQDNGDVLVLGLEAVTEDGEEEEEEEEQEQEQEQAQQQEQEQQQQHEQQHEQHEEEEANDTDTAPERGLAKELMWAEMLSREQASAILLGWNAAMWDAGDTPPCVEMPWAELSDAEKEAAALMGYTQDDWDAEEEFEEDDEDEGDEDSV
eukprot:COSAG02_NODE_1467_length_12482_cov_6.138577_2_plen_568_part_00